MASADYLKKYLSTDDSKSKKKKKSKKSENHGGMKVVEDDAFIMVKPKSRGMPSDEEDEVDETAEEIRQKQKQAEKMKFRSDTFQPVEDLPANERTNDSNSRRQRHDSDNDDTPPRRKRHDSDRDPSPPRRKRHDSDHEETSTRRRQRHDSDASPPRRNDRHESDTSPPRRRKDASPPRRRGRDDSDISPPRRKVHNSDRDASPPRRNRRHDSDESPPRRSIKRERDASPPRRSHHRSSPDRIDRKSSVVIRKRSPPSPAQFNDDRRVKTLDGKKAGLVSAKEMRKELGEHKKRETNAMEGLDDELTGRFAETKIRTKITGKNREGTKEDEEKKAREERKNEELKEKYEKWNRGVAQLKEREAQLKEEERVMKEGFSRYADDEAMNEHLKDEILAEDPMAALISKKREKIEIRKGLVYPSYKGHWPPNRYNIAPGYRWDGVNRSNGFEAQLSLAANRRKADEEAAYRAITECAE